MRIEKVLNEHLSKYIEYYYFMSSNSNKELNFIYYPHYHKTLNIFHESTVNASKEYYEVISNKKQSLCSVLSFDRRDFKTARVIGPYDIIGIVFKPLGIHHFFNMKELNLNSNSEVEINLKQSNNKVEYNSSFFDTIHISERVQLIEKYLISQIKIFDNPSLESIVNTIIKKQGNIMVNELESLFSVSRRTLSRWFHKYLYCPPSEFCKIVKFRTAIEKSKEFDKKLTRISYESHYYDQSDFIKHFKSLTGEAPKSLLKHLKNNDGRPILWKHSIL